MTALAFDIAYERSYLHITDFFGLTPGYPSENSFPFVTHVFKTDVSSTAQQMLIWALSTPAHMSSVKKFPHFSRTTMNTALVSAQIQPASI